MRDSGLYRKPFFVALALFALGACLIAGGIRLAAGGGPMDSYALVAFGIFALIASAAVFLAYRRLEREFFRTLGSEPLLRFRADGKMLAENVEERVAGIRARNRAALLVMLAFCALVALVLPFFFEDGYLFIFIGAALAAFLALAAWAVTAYRVRKARRGDGEFIVSADGAYVCGEFHAWNTPKTKLVRAAYRPPAGEGPGRIEIEYAAAYPAPASQALVIPVPGDQAEAAGEIVRLMNRKRRT